MIRTSRQPIRKLHFGYGPGVTDQKKIKILMGQDIQQDWHYQFLNKNGDVKVLADKISS